MQHTIIGTEKHITIPFWEIIARIYDDTGRGVGFFPDEHRWNRVDLWTHPIWIIAEVFTVPSIIITGQYEVYFIVAIRPILRGKEL